MRSQNKIQKYSIFTTKQKNEIFIQNFTIVAFKNDS